MILKHEPKGDPRGLAVWRTDLSWFEGGKFIPITVIIQYAYPNMEVIDVDIDCPRSVLESSGFRIESVLAATALEEFTKQRETLRREHNKSKKNEPVNRIDPMFH